MQQSSSESTLNQLCSGPREKASLPFNKFASTTNMDANEGHLDDSRNDETTIHQLGNAEKLQSPPRGPRVEGTAIYVDYEEADPRNPINFSRLCAYLLFWMLLRLLKNHLLTYRRKYSITLTACFILALSSAAGSTYNQGFNTMMPELHTTQSIADIGLATYSLGCGVSALMTASLSEEFGRIPLYIVSAGGFAVTHLMIAL
jgi:hypothetical protein